MRRITPATVLILLIFGAASILAWQAYDAARSHRRAAERLLNDYAQFAGWEFARVSQGTLENALRDWSHTACACDDIRTRTTFRLTGGRIETAGDALPAGADAWIRAFSARTTM